MTKPQPFVLKELRAHGARSWASLAALLLDVPGFNYSTDYIKIATLEGAASGTNIYTYFPRLLEPEDSGLSERQLDDLSLATLLLLLHTMINDHLIDRDKEELPSGPNALIAAQSSLLWAWSLFESACGSAPLPWPALLKTYSRYCDSVSLEVTLLSSGGITRENVADLVAGKSALARLVSTMVCHLGRCAESADVLGRSVENFHLSSNLVDDLNDWKLDLREGRHTYLLSRIFQEGKLTPDKETRKNPEFIRQCASILYSSGVLEQYCQEIADWQEAAIQDSLLARSPRWTQYLCICRSRVALRHNRVRAAIRKHLVEVCGVRVSLGPKRVFEPGARFSSFSPQVAEDLIAAGCKAIQFLRERWVQGYGLSDFCGHRGPLNLFVTAQVCIALHQWNARTDDIVSRSLLCDAVRILAQQQGPEGWRSGNHPKLAADALTTSAALRVLARADEHCESLGRGYVALLNFMREDGSFGRYLPSEAASGSPARYHSSPDVTAEAIVALVALPSHLAPAPTPVDVSRAASDALRNMRPTSGLWSNGWLCSLAYTNSIALEALDAVGRPLPDSDRISVLNAITRAQQQNGAWPGADGRDSAFETASSIRLLTLLPRSRYVIRSMARGIEWLVVHQLNDGSWPSNPVLRVRMPANADEYASQAGAGFPVADSNRCLTTSVVIRSLAVFQQHFGDRRVIIRTKEASAQVTAAQALT